MSTRTETKKAEKANAKALAANPGYIVINMGPNRHARRAADSMNRRTK